MEIENRENIIAIATPPGNGALGIIRLSGDSVLQIANEFIHKKIEPEQFNRVFFRKIIDEGQVIEHAVITYFKGPNSYTGENIIEISTHGNLILMGKVVEIFLKNKNLRIAEPGEFTKRAFMNGKMDLTQAESIADLISASSLSAARLSMKHIEGDVRNYLTDIKKDLLETSALLEIELDFSQEDLEFVERKNLLNRLHKIRKEIIKTLEIYRSKKYLREGINIAIIGKPNVGKSSLLNAIIGRERAIVSHIPGTTRDYLDETIHFKGININFIDTAGLHKSDDHIEKEGIKFSFEKAKMSDLTIVVMDNSKPIGNRDIDIFERIKKENIDKILVVLNKSDLGNNINNEEIIEIIGKEITEKAIEVSAKNRTNVDLIKQKIYEFFQKDFLDAESEIILTNERQFTVLHRTAELIESAIANVEKGIPTEMTAFDLREIVNLLSSMTGEIRSEDILNNIFNSFCIGK